MTEYVVGPDEGTFDLWERIPELSALNFYRFHRTFTTADQHSITRHAIKRMLGDRKAVLRLLVRNGKVIALCAISPLTWDSVHYGISMGRLDCLATQEASPSTLRLLINSTLEAAKKLDIRHVSTHIDIDDYPLLHALTDSGFHIMDTKRTFIARRYQRPSRGNRIVLPVRPYRHSDRADVERLTNEVTFETRFTRDSLLERDRSLQLYSLWMTRLLDAPADKRALQVVERGGRIVACGGVIEIDFSAAGVPKRILADGVFACTTEGTGSYLSVIDALIAEGLARYPLLETRVSQNNLAAVRVLEYLGYSTAASQYALHLHIQR